MNAKLTKRYFFPLVKGTSFGIIKIGRAIKSAFVNFILEPWGWTKILNFHPTMNHFLKFPILAKTAIAMFGREYKACKKANKYLEKQYERLAKAIENKDIDRYSAIFRILFFRSDYFLMAIFCNKIRFYANNYSPRQVYRIRNDIRRIIRMDKNNLKFKRVFLTEYNPDGTFKKFRPLGVPDIRWRVIAAMYEFYLVNLFKADWHPNQYACMPKVGVVDAWIEILRNLEESPNIVGVDLAKFFDTVFMKPIEETLLEERVPSDIVARIMKINKSKPKISKEDKGKEKIRIEELRKEAPIIYYPAAEDYMNWAGETNWNPRTISLPQGLNTSPFLSCLILNGTGALDCNKSKVIQYVDDAILMGKKSLKEMYLEYDRKLNTPSTGDRKSVV